MSDGVLVVFAESTIAAQPGEAPLHNPGQASDLECALTTFYRSPEQSRGVKRPSVGIGDTILERRCPIRY